MTDATELNAETARELAAETRRLIRNDCIAVDFHLKHQHENLYALRLERRMLDLIDNQQQLLDYAFARIEALERDSAREGGGR